MCSRGTVVLEASLMTAIDVRLWTAEAPRVEVPDPTYGTAWKLTEDALTATHIAIGPP